jgi:hypothetical protein
VAALLGGPNAVIPDELARRISGLGSRDTAERQSAHHWITELLARHRKSWNDLTDFLCVPSSPSWADDRPQSNEKSNNHNPINLVHLVYVLLEEYVVLKQHEYTAMALWILHSHVFDRFMVTPRLALLSAVRGCGKTVLLSVTEALVAKPEKTDAITSAAIYHLIDSDRPTLLVDEVDNLGLALAANGKLRMVFNSGHRRGGAVIHMNQGQPQKYSTFSPLALAAIGTLPKPLLHRSIVIAMERHDGRRELRRFDGTDPGLDVAYSKTLLWAKRVTLDPNPEMPEALRNRQADNWRPLIAIGDAYGWGAQAREAAVTFAKSYQDEDTEVLLLQDIRTGFDALGHRPERDRRCAPVRVARPPWRSAAVPTVAGRAGEDARSVWNPAENDLAVGPHPRQQERQRLSPLAIRGGVAVLHERHAVTSQQSQAFAGRLMRHTGRHGRWRNNEDATLAGGGGEPWAVCAGHTRCGILALALARSELFGVAETARVVDDRQLGF